MVQYVAGIPVLILVRLNDVIVLFDSRLQLIVMSTQMAVHEAIRNTVKLKTNADCTFKALDKKS